jgi:hypothetical protein
LVIQGPGDTEEVKVGETIAITTINHLKFTTMKIKFWISALAVVAISNFAMAQETPSAKGNAASDKNVTRPAFVDNNKDGICDNYASGRSMIIPGNVYNDSGAKCTTGMGVDL